METGGKEAAHNSTETAVEQLGDTALNEIVSDYIDAQRTEALTASEVGEEAIEQVAERTEQEMIAHNIDRLESYFGDQAFSYKSHKGTITAIVNLCPPIKDLLSYKEGFDDIVAMIEPYKVTEETDEEDSDDEAKEAELLAAEAAEREAAAAAAKEKAEKAAAEKVAAEKAANAAKAKADAQETQKSKAADPVEKESATTRAAQEGDADSGVVPSPDTAEVPEPPAKESILERVLEAERTETAIESEIKSEGEGEGEVKPESEPEDEPSATSAQPVEATSLDSEIVDTPKATESTTELTASTEVEPSSPEEAPHLTEQADEPLEMLGIDDDTETTLPADHTEVEGEEAEQPEAEQAPTPEERPIALFESPLLEEWRQLGEHNAPVEVALATIVDQLEALRTDEENEKESQEEGGQPEYALFTAPEIIYLTKRVEKARMAIEKLQTATTKEECHEHVQEVVTELTRLLTLLGYENPHDIIQEFLKQYPLQSLHDLLEYLETSLRHSIERQQSHKQQTSSPKHTSMLAHVAMRIMQVLAPKYETA